MKKDTLVIKIPHPIYVLTAVVMLCWLLYSLLTPLMGWYTAIIDKNAMLIKAKAQVEANQLLSISLRKDPLLVEYLTAQQKKPK